MTDRQPVALSDDDIAAVRSWVIHEDAHVIAESVHHELERDYPDVKHCTVHDNPA